MLTQLIKIILCPRWAFRLGAVQFLVVGIFLQEFVPFNLKAQSSTETVVLRTGEGMPFATATQQINLLNTNSPNQLRFQFGFGTDEVPAPGNLLDSFSVSLQDISANQTLAILTVDGSGVLWAPSTDGGIPLTLGDITRASIAFPSLQPITSSQWAYEVILNVPAAFSGLVDVHFDLFDNLNSAQSLGWYSQITSIPEPPPLAFYGFAGLILLMWRMGKSRD